MILRAIQPGAKDGASKTQKCLALLAVGGLVLICILSDQPAAWLGLILSPVFLAIIAVQLGAAFEKLPMTARLSASERNWPRYTILVPLYREAAVVRDLEAALSTLDYPAAQLEILLLLEQDDTETQDAIRAIRVPSFYQVVIVPDGAPRTKPRALNHGLALATGSFVTVFDAEDIPDVDQLKKAVLAFERLPSDVMCLQARLVIDNGDDGWLPRMMAIEYATLFDVLKCGLTAEGFAVPLGGTSNHFRTEELLKLGGWDAWNVTEDADLGLRIAQCGGKIEDLHSSTYEEAPIRFKSWLGQRRRWLKGWAQTGICHARQPMAGIKAMGLLGWCLALIQVFGMVIGALTFPFFGLWIVWNIVTGDIWDTASWLAFLTNSLALGVLFVGLLGLAIPPLLGLKRRGRLKEAPWLLTFPGYLMLISLAAWLAMIDLVRRPFHWEKTDHGFGKRQAATLRNRQEWRS